MIPESNKCTHPLASNSPSRSSSTSNLLSGKWLKIMVYNGILYVVVKKNEEG